MVQSVRGINAFEKEQDKALYLSLLEHSVKEKSSCLIGYVIMDQFVHLVIEEGNEGAISDIIRRANSVFCRQYRHRNLMEPKEKLFRDRFYSEPIEDERSLVLCVKQIHEIPLRYGIVYDVNAYYWSSCRMYAGLEPVTAPYSVKKVQEALHFAGGFAEFSKRTRERIPMLREKTKAYGLTDEEATRLFEKYLDGKDMGALGLMTDEERRETIRRVRTAEGISILQLSRITGISRGIIQHLK